MHNLLVKGRLIVFEGIDGAGKATQTRALAAHLRSRGERVTVFSSPRYDLPTGKLVHAALAGEYGSFVGLSPYLSALPYLVDFAAWREDIVRALAKGTVICDRYVQSTICYHGAKLKGKKRAEFIGAISRIAFKSLRLPHADRIVLLDVPVSHAQARIAKRKKDQHEKDISYQRDVLMLYRELAKKKPWKRIDCVHEDRMRSIGDIARSVREAVLR